MTVPAAPSFNTSPRAQFAPGVENLGLALADSHPVMLPPGLAPGRRCSVIGLALDAVGVVISDDLFEEAGMSGHSTPVADNKTGADAAAMMMSVLMRRLPTLPAVVVDRLQQ
ncbi:hypothetical protein ACG873_21555 [Mesorhizobium sp. AaZ16]|uniref:hypothetical protein n=1 Tax=Mesorhizobium sp. AaZ16 TaxID=3402289 RepID=UPI00374EF655